jgi:hypothetical protein
MPAAPAAAADEQEIAQAPRAGGLAIVVSHGATFSDQVDTDPLNPGDIAAQRNLNNKHANGWNEWPRIAVAAE